MNRIQFLTLCGCAFSGCFLGGLTAQWRPTPAQAQVQIRSENTLFVPEGGLRMVTPTNRVIGVITDQGGNGGIVLINSNGKPSLTMSAGTGGFVDVSAATPAIRVLGPNGQEGATLTANDGSASLKLKTGAALSSNNKGGLLLLGTQKGTPGLQLDTQAEGGRLTGFDEGKSMQYELKSKGGEGVLSLFKKDSEAGFQAGGAGSAEVRRDKETVWKVPQD